MPQCGFWTFVFPFQALLDLMSRSWYHPIPQERFRKVGREQSWLCLHPALLVLPGPVKQELHIPQAPQHSCQCSMPCPSVQLLRAWGTPALVPAQFSSSSTFLLEKGQHNLTEFISALASCTLQTKCSPPADFPQTLGLWTGVKSLFY